MKKQLNALVSGAAGFGLFLAGCVMAGLGLAVAFILAMFALAAMAVGLLAAPLLAWIEPKADDEPSTETTAA